MHTNRRLFDLATKNAQKLALEEYLLGVTSDFRDIFDPEVRVFHPEISDLLAPVVSRANQFQDGKLQKHSDIEVQHTSSRERAINMISGIIPNLANGRYLLVVGGGNGSSFDGGTYWVSEQPGHYVSLPEAIPKILGLLQLGIDEMVLAAADFDAAVVLETISGFLQEEPSVNEVIFELSAWGHHV